MGRRRKSGQKIDGWVILDKAFGMTSTAAVGAVRRIFDANKAGHAGTLDPLASGVLPIALGEATKTLPYVVDTEKSYQFTLKWGEATTTDDREGEITDQSDARPSEAEIIAGLIDFIGEIEQVPPAFSAISMALSAALQGEGRVEQWRIRCGGGQGRGRCGRGGSARQPDLSLPIFAFADVRTCSDTGIAPPAAKVRRIGPDGTERRSPLGTRTTAASV